jgi:hypothetical protein
MRFVAIEDPAGSWAVFDTANEEPAEVAGRVLIGLTPHEAQWLAAAANNEAQRRETDPVDRIRAGKAEYRQLVALQEKRERSSD